MTTAPSIKDAIVHDIMNPPEESDPCTQSIVAKLVLSVLDIAGIDLEKSMDYLDAREYELIRKLLPQLGTIAQIITGENSDA